jgi:hypothetical protein
VQLFQQHGNTSIDGVDCINGCYGATAALFNAAAWVQSSFWDGRLALVVAADVAIYAPGSSARATGVHCWPLQPAALFLLLLLLALLLLLILLHAGGAESACAAAAAGARDGCASC